MLDMQEIQGLSKTRYIAMSKMIPVLGYDLRTPSGGKRCLEWFCMTEGSCVDVCIVFSSKSHENNSKTSSFPPSILLLLVAL